MLSTDSGTGSTDISGAGAARCSDVQVEPLAGSAKKETVHLVFEWPQGWSRDVLDGDTFGEDLTRRLKGRLDGVAGLQLVRQPGREGRQIESHHLFLVFTDRARTEKLIVDGPEALLDLDLSGPGRNGAEEFTDPLVLVCTHGKRDVCCAVKGRPMAAGLAERHPGPVVWETSHTKGHRFAPSMLVMPWGYSFGRLNEEAASSMVAAVRAGEYFHPGNRGRGLYGPRGQVAELAVAQQLLGEGESLRFGELAVSDEDAAPGPRVAHVDGRVWVVELEEREVGGIVSSCGDDPKTGPVWIARDVHPAG